MHRAVERLCGRSVSDDLSAAGGLAKNERGLERLTAAVAAGGDVPTLLPAIRAREAQRPSEARELASLMSGSWNRLIPWLRAVDQLRRAA